MILSRYLIPAALTGVFCAIFAFFVHLFASMLEREVIVGVSFVSGFLGSMFSKLCWKGDMK